MRKAALFSTLTLIGSLTAPLSSPAAVIYRSTEGWSVEGDDSSTVESSAAEQMRKAESFETAGNSKAAYSAYRVLVKQFGLSALAPKAQRKVGILLEKSGDYDKAFDAYGTYVEKYPRGEDFDSVVESMFKIAKLFLDGEKSKKLLGISVGGSVDRAIEMFGTILKSAPYSKWASAAQFNVGQAFERQGKYPEALSAYQSVLSRYSGDPIASDAQYQMGYVLLKEYREGSYDRVSAQKAREAFEDFISRYPESEKVAQARENMKTLEGGSAKGSLDIAKFYEKTKQYKAAVIYYNDVIKQQPDSAESGIAKARIEELKQLHGEDALRAGPEKAETGAKAATRRKLQARVDTVSRPDYVGPPVKVAAEKSPEVSTSPGRPKLRTSPNAIGPVPPVEPPLPVTPIKTEPEAPKPEAGADTKPGQ